MVDLELLLSLLGLPQYLDRFVQAGFDSWETVMEITEDDLEVLNVELGHRRKLQREIANSRELALHHYQTHDPFPFSARSMEENVIDSKWQNNPSDQAAVVQGKRGYVHHPKPDPSAPERPPSAYVLFSKMVRQELKSHHLSFTDMSRQVGERWQRLTPEEKHSWKQKAAIPREEYKINFAKYQRSENHRSYLRYLSDFRSAQAMRRGDESPFRNVPEAASPSVNRLNTSTVQPELNPAHASHGLEMNDIETYGERVPRAVDLGAKPSRYRRTRTVQACEPCRQRKVKCRGERPSCEKCRHLNLACSYGELRRGGRKLTGDNLWRKFRAYETILRRLVPLVGDEDKAAIQKSLLMPPQLDQEPAEQQPYNMDGDEESDDADGESDISCIGSMGSKHMLTRSNLRKQNLVWGGTRLPLPVYGKKGCGFLERESYGKSNQPL